MELLWFRTKSCRVHISTLFRQLLLLQPFLKEVSQRCPLDLDWGVDGEIFEVTNGDFQKNTLKIFGYGYTHEKMKGLRDLFQNTKTLYAYKLTSGGTKASNTFAEAFIPAFVVMM